MTKSSTHDIMIMLSRDSLERNEMAVAKIYQVVKTYVVYPDEIYDEDDAEESDPNPIVRGEEAVKEWLAAHDAKLIREVDMGE